LLFLDKYGKRKVHEYDTSVSMGVGRKYSMLSQLLIFPGKAKMIFPRGTKVVNNHSTHSTFFLKTFF